MKAEMADKGGPYAVEEALESMKALAGHVRRLVGKAAAAVNGHRRTAAPVESTEVA
jgi:hypothetical protein